ncbi:MAG: recombinase family protein [Dactylosporangium sp.]|nr:recombinase family protein [Dactylosporangium sp.]
MPTKPQTARKPRGQPQPTSGNGPSFDPGLFTPQPRLRIGIYLRISTDELHQPFSLEAQRLKLGAYINSQDNWELAMVFSDQASGATTERPDLQRALSAARAGRFDILLVYRVDRLSRSIRGLSDILAQLDDARVAFRSATEPFDTATPAGRMMVQMLAVFAEFERATIIDRVINGMERKAARGQWCGGYRPHGYDLDHTTGFLSVIGAEAAIVRRIFTDYTRENTGAKNIATRLNTAGHRTKTGKPWSGNSVLVVLRNRVYLGEVFYRDRWYTPPRTTRRSSTPTPSTPPSRSASPEATTSPTTPTAPPTTPLRG